MRLDDDLPTPKPQSRLVLRNLEPLGVKDLEAYLGELREEIARTEAEIVRKGKTRDAAESFFRFKSAE